MKKATVGLFSNARMDVRNAPTTIIKIMAGPNGTIIQNSTLVVNSSNTVFNLDLDLELLKKINIDQDG